jgi:hypothetical protein
MVYYSNIYRKTVTYQRLGVDLHDHLLYLQLAVARLGERELQGWWNTDIAYKLGGAGFLERITSPLMAPYSAGAGVLLAARLLEESLLESIPGNPAYSLFSPPLPLRNELTRRYQHFKRYPEDTPEEIRAILDINTDWTAAMLRDLIKQETGGITPEYEGTSFGREIAAASGATGAGESGAAGLEPTMNALAAVYLALEKGKFALPYFRAKEL